LQYLRAGYYPVLAPSELLVNWKGKLPISMLSEVIKLHKNKSYRDLAQEFGVSHESVRRAIITAKDSGL
jgi:hypothetical protein